MAASAIVQDALPAPLPPATAPVATPAPARAGARRGALAVLWGAWGISALLALGYLTQPVGAAAQIALSGAAGAGMLVLWLLFPKRGLPRMAFLALGTLVVVRYVYWRLAGTLPAPDDPVGFGLGLVLALAELYCVLILTVSLIVNADPLVRADAPALPDAALPSVDVFVPSYNESAGILGLTLAAARALDYPAGRATVWLLDDGGTDQKCADPDPGKAAAARARRAELQALCTSLGCRYLTRARNEHAKAGNLNNGLRHASAEIVLVLDADHAPFRSFLRETVGLFAADPKLFLVQTPHVFLNPDPVERNLRTFARMPSENEMFYGVTQAGLDKWNGSFFCGSAALLRRAALDEVGGFSGITITEDCETAFELHGRGWTSAYVDKPLIAGLQPETFADFIGQRSRWCQGMFQIMLLKNPLTKRGLKPIQRLCYLSSMTFWFFPLPRLIFMLAPLLHIFFDVKIFVSSIDEALAFTATYAVANMMMQNYLYGHVRWPWVSELYEYVQGVYLARAIVSVLVSPRRPSFNVTSKGVSLDRDHLSPLAWPFFAIYAALAAGCATAAWRYLFEPGVTGLMLVVGLWCLFNLVLAGTALGVVAERAQAERCPSLPVRRDARAAFGAETVSVVVERASSEDCVLRPAAGAAWPAAARTGADGLLTLPGAGCAPLPFRLGEAGAGGRRAAFGPAGPDLYRGLAALMYGDAGALRAFLAGRQRHKNLLAGTLQVLAWSVTEPVRAASYALRRAPAPTPAIADAIPAPMADQVTVQVAVQAAATVPVAVPLAGLPASAPETAAPQPALAPAALRAALAPDLGAVARMAAGIATIQAVEGAAADPIAAAPLPLPILPVAAITPAARFEDPAVPPLTEAAWRGAVAGLAAAEDPAGLDPAAWLAEIRALAGAERAVPLRRDEPVRRDLPRRPSLAAPDAPLARSAA